MYTFRSREQGSLKVYGNITGPIEDFISLFSAFEELYNLVLVLSESLIFDEYINVSMLRKLLKSSINTHRYGDYYLRSYESDLILPEERLVLSSINFSSTGIFDLLGVASVLEQIREFIKDITYRNNQQKWAGRIELLQKINDSSLIQEEKRLLINKIYAPLNRIKRDIDMKKITDVKSGEAKE